MRTPFLLVGALLSLGARAEVGYWENLTEGSSAPLTVAIGEAMPPWDFEVTFTNLVAFDQISLNNKYPQLVTLSDGSASQNLSVNGWDNSRDLFLTGSKVATQDGTPLGNVNANNDVGNGELWAPTNGVMTLAFSDDGTHLTVSQNGHLFLKTDKRTANGKIASLTLGGGLSLLGGGMIASARIRYEGRATVVRAHPRLTAGLERESLIGIRFSGHRAGALGPLTFSFALTNCTPDQITDIRLWRQKYDPIPFAFFERDAVELTVSDMTATRTATDGLLTVAFAPKTAESPIVYPLAEGRGESDYVWLTAKFADNLATNAEIWTSLAQDTVMLGDSVFTVTNGLARAPHRPFPYRYQIGAYLRQDRIAGNGKVDRDVLSDATEARLKNLTDVMVIYSLVPSYSNGRFSFDGHWDANGQNDTASTAGVVARRDLYHPQCMVRGSIEKGGWCSANGISGAAFEVAGAGEATRKQFAGYLVEFCKTHHLDGMDLDYEWATTNNRREWQNIGKMLREITEQFFDHGLVMTLSTRGNDTAMPNNTAEYGAFNVADFCTAQAYGGGWINANPWYQRQALGVCTNRGVPKRRVVLGQAMYSPQGQYGWDGAISYLLSFSTDRFRRFDSDTTNPTSDSDYHMFEGVSSYHAQCDWARSENLGGVMSWGYYTDPGWDNWYSLGRHQAQTIWPMARVWATPEKSGDWYVLKGEEDWFWLFDHPDVNAKFGCDITLTHDPLVMPTWTGTLDGAGHTLTIAEDAWVTSGEATGLIRTLCGTVRNLTVVLNGRVYTQAARWNDCNQEPAVGRLHNTMAGENPVGVIAAEAGDGAIIENVHVVLGAGSEVKGVKDVGALVGRVAPATAAVIITNNTVEIGGKLHVEVRNVWDTLFQPDSPAIGAVVGRVVSNLQPSTSQTITNNSFTVVAGGEIQDLDEIPSPAYELEGAWLEPTGWDRTLPFEVDVRSGDWALEAVLELPNYTGDTLTAGQYPGIVGLVGNGTTVTLSANGDGGGELFLTGSNAASYAYPVSKSAIRGNGDVGSGVGLAVTNADRTVVLRIENRNGELRVIQNGATILVTDKNNGDGGYLQKAIVGAGLAQLGGGRVVSVRERIDRRSEIVHPAGYGKLVFDDEFGGDSLNAENWEKVPVANLHVNWRQYTSHREDLVAVSNGCLVLTGVKNDGRDPDETRKFLCGQVQSNDKFCFKYGMVEIRAKFENQDGAWPAMWMMPQYSVHGGWPYSGEIDISERLNSDSVTHQTAHFGYGDKDSTSTTTASIRNGEFNVYRLEWTEDKITWYVNDVETHSYSNDGSGYLKWPFDSEFYFILSQQLEGSWVGTVDDESTLPVRMYVDYVRVWQKDEDARKNAYLWLDAANAESITTNETGEMTEWRSANLLGNVARKYALSSDSPSGPALTNGVVSFGTTSANCDLAFDRATDLRTVVMVAKVEQSGNAFLLGDSGNYDFHRGASGEWWASGNASANIRNGQTYWNGECVTNATSAVMPDALGLIEVHAAGNVTASQICYDRVGNGNVPRRGGKDVAELLLFKDALSYTDRLKLRQRLIEKWLPDLAHPNWSITGDWVLRRENDYSAGISVADAFMDGAGTYEFKNVKFTGGLQSSAYTLRVQDGDTIELSGDTLNGRCCFGFDVRGGRVTFPECAGTWYEHATYRQTGGSVVSLATSTAQSGTGDGFMLGYNGKTMTLDIEGGLFAVSNSSINCYDPLTVNVGGTVCAKGMFRSSGNAATVNVNVGGRLEIGALGLKANTCTLNLNGGTLASFEDGAAIHNEINLAADSTIEIPAGMTLTVDGAITGTNRLALAGEGTLRLVAAVTSSDIENGTAKALLNVPDGFPLARCEVYLTCSDYQEKAGSCTVRDGILYAEPPDPCESAYLWLDASAASTITTNASGEVTEWRSINANGATARKYTLSSQSPAGPVLVNYQLAATNCQLVSFGSSSANRDLGFMKSTAVRTVFMVAKVEQSGNAFLLGDNANYDFHRGSNGEYWHSVHGKPKDGKTYWNGEEVSNTTSTKMPDALGLITVETAGNLTASQLCYDRAGNGNTPRRGGKDIAELLVFENTLTEPERRRIEKRLIAKWIDNPAFKGTARVVRAHPRLTRGLDRESLLGIRFDGNYGGTNSELKIKICFTNCTSSALSDLRLWRQPYDKPYAFYEAQATQIATGTVTENNDGELKVSFVNTGTHIYPKVGTRSDSDYLWVTATIDPDIPTDAEIWTTVENETLTLGSSAYVVENGVAKSPHRVFPYKYQIGAYLRQDWLGANNAGKLEDNPAARLGNLTDVILINNMKVTYDSTTGLFGTSWGDGDTASSARVKSLRDAHHGRCMVRAGLTKGTSTMTLNGITAYPIACAAANENTRTQLVASIVKVLDDNDLDGLDIDWEYPGDGSGSTAAMMKRDWGYYGLLLRDLAAAFFDKGYVLSLCTNLGYSMPTASGVGSDVYGALHAADYIDSMAYGNTTLNSSPQVMQTAINVCTACGVPKRRIVVGQAIYAYEGWNPGWNSVVGWLANAYPYDLSRRYDADMLWMNREFKSGTWVWKETFEGPSSYHAKLNWCRSGEYGGVMSWGYYTDCNWDEANHMSLARHQAQAMWPVATYRWPTPEVKVEGQGQEWYLLKSEEDWFWLRDHSNVKAKFANDITLEHDPLPIAQWTGTLDGDGHTLTIPRDTWICLNDNPALITQLDGTVKNLTIDLYGRVVSRASRWNDTSVTSGTQPAVNQSSEPGTIAHATANTMSTPLTDHYAAVLACKARWGAYVENVHLVVREGAEIQGPSRTAGIIADMYCGAGNTCIMTNVTVKNCGTIRSVARNTAETDLSYAGVSVGALVAYANGASGATVRIAGCSVEKGQGGRIAAETGTNPSVATTIGTVTGTAVRENVTEAFDPEYEQPDWTHFTTTTSSSPVWTEPYDGVWTDAGACTIATTPIGFSVGSTATMLTINLIAQLPSGRSGALAGWKVDTHTVQLYYDAATDRFNVTYDGTTSHSGTTTYAPADVTQTHVYTIAISAASDGTEVYQDGNLIVNAPGVKWSGKTLGTAYTIGSDVDGSQILYGMFVRGADYDFSANANRQSRILSGYGDVITNVSTAVALKILAEAKFEDGAPVVPEVSMNGRTLSAGEAATAYWMFDADMSDATNLTFSLDAPVVADGRVGLSMGGDDPINAALHLETANDPAGPWRTAAEIAAGTTGRTFVFETDDDTAFYALSASVETLPQPAEGMPVSLTSESRVRLGDVTITADDLAHGSLEVQLAGAGVAEGMIASLQVDGVALVAHADANGKLRFNLSGVMAAPSLQGEISLYTTAGMTNGDIRVSSPAVSGLTYSPAVLTEMVANTLYADGFTEQDYGWAYRIPSLVSDRAGEVLCLYDVRYGGGDLGTGSGIDIGETHSADFGKTFAKPHLAIDVPNTCNEKNQSIAESRTNDLGDVATLYDPATETYWLMGMGGRGLNDGKYEWNDVLLYKRGKGAGTLKWEKVRSIQEEIAVQEGITNSTGGLGFGFLQGPGHGMVTTVGTAAMPVGTLVFPMQYFVDGWSSTVGAVYSKDHGETWTATRRSTGGTTPQENCVMELDDGSWYMTTKAGSRPGTGRINFFRTTDYTNWTYVGEHYPVPCQQGSCLRIGQNATDGNGRYVLCHTLHPDTATRARLALIFGTDTTAEEGENGESGEMGAGVAWDFDNPLMLYYDNTGFKGYNSLAMIDDHTLGVLYEAQGHIYFIRIDVSDRLK